MLKKIINFLFGIKAPTKRESIYKDYRPPLQKLAEKEGVRYPNLDTNHLFIRNQKFLDGEGKVSSYEDEKVMREYAKLIPTVEKIQKKRREAVEKLVAKRIYNASPGHSFNNNTSTHYVDNTPSIIQAAVLYSVLSDSSESVGTRVDSHSVSNEQYCSPSSSSSYSSSDSYSSCDSSSSYSGSCD